MVPALDMGPVRHTFTLPLTVDPPTANSRLHWTRRATITRSIRQTCAIVASSERVRLGVVDARKDDEARWVRLTFVRPGQRGAHLCDLDALAAKGKPILDALVQSGWLRDDSPRWLTSVGYGQERGDRLEVRVEVGHLDPESLGEPPTHPQPGLGRTTLPSGDGADVDLELCREFVLRDRSADPQFPEMVPTHKGMVSPRLDSVLTTRLLCLTISA